MRRLRLWVSVMLVCLVLSACADPGTLRIEGPDAFKKDIGEALTLIEQKSPEQYRSLRRLAKGILMVDEPPNSKTGAWTTTGSYICISKETYSILVEGEKTDPRNLTYGLALSLVHETAHLVQMAQGYSHNSDEREREAIAAERILLECLGEPPDVIERVASDHRLESRHWEALE